MWSNKCRSIGEVFLFSVKAVEMTVIVSAVFVVFMMIKVPKKLYGTL